MGPIEPPRKAAITDGRAEGNPNMGRPSKLTERQWEEVGKRLLGGEKPAALAREFKVSKATLSERFSKRTETVKSVANQIVETRDALDALGLSEQLAAISLADD